MKSIHWIFRKSAVFLTIGVCAFSDGCGPNQASLERGLAFLASEQVRGDLETWGSVDFAGDWPQYFLLDGVGSARVRDVSPFIVAFVHHALTRVVESNAEALGLAPEYVHGARVLRMRAADFLVRFAATPEDPAAGTFGFWPYDRRPPGTALLAQWLVLAAMKGPILNGTRTPINFGIVPRVMDIPTDADVTATTYAALLDDSLLDGGPGAAAAPAQFFSDWRDTGEVARRANPPWLPEASGAYLTWLNYGSPATPNDVDLVVNANVLYGLGRYGLLDTPGVMNAAALINQVTASGLHRTHPEQISLYYPDNYMFQYAVSRAYHEGPVPELQPAVEILADGLEQDALQDADGTAHWDKGAPDLNTAFAVLTLMNAGRDTPLIGRGIAYLASRQDPLLGNWREGVFFIARADSGREFGWVSRSFTTAMAVEAFCRYALESQ